MIRHAGWYLWTEKLRWLQAAPGSERMHLPNALGFTPLHAAVMHTTTARAAITNADVFVDLCVDLQSVSQPDSQSGDQLVNQSFSQSVRQTDRQTDSQSDRQSVSLSGDQLVSYSTVSVLSGGRRIQQCRANDCDDPLAAPAHRLPFPCVLRSVLRDLVTDLLTF